MERRSNLKGFIHIVEIVIITLVMFILVIQFSSIPGAKQDWDKTKLSLRGNDLLYSLDAAGINWLDADEVDQALSQALGGSVVYDVRVKNVLKPEIQVGCICTDTESAYMESVLGPFTLNGQHISFRVHKIDPSRIAFPGFYDVIVMGEWAGTNAAGAWDSYYGEIENFLSGGGGLLQMRSFGGINDLDAADINLFGLSWDSGLGGPTSAKTVFSTEPGDMFYNIEKYFHYIPGGVNLSVWSGFSTFQSSGKISPSNQEDYRAVLKQKNTGIPMLIVNSQVSNARGRTAWLAAGQDSDERRQLVRALVAWLSGEEYRVVPSDISAPTVFNLYKVFGPDMVQPAEIVLSLGYLF